MMVDMIVTADEHDELIDAVAAAPAQPSAAKLEVMTGVPARRAQAWIDGGMAWPVPVRLRAVDGGGA